MERTGAILGLHTMSFPVLQACWDLVGLEGPCLQKQSRWHVSAFSDSWHLIGCDDQSPTDPYIDFAAKQHLEFGPRLSGRKLRKLRGKQHKATALTISPPALGPRTELIQPPVFYVAGHS